MSKLFNPCEMCMVFGRECTDKCAEFCSYAIYVELFKNYLFSSDGCRYCGKLNECDGKKCKIKTPNGTVQNVDAMIVDVKKILEYLEENKND